MPNLKLEVGKKYINRRNDVIEIVYFNERECRKNKDNYLGVMEGDHSRTWFHENGSYDSRSISTRDLVREYEEPDLCKKDKIKALLKEIEGLLE